MNKEDLHKNTESIPLTEMIRERRLRYIGHIAGYPEERWGRLGLNAEVEGYERKQRGAPNKSWLSTTNADLKSLHASWEDCVAREQHWRKVCSGEVVLRAIGQARGDYDVKCAIGRGQLE